MKPISQYEVIDHGICHSDYFQGCGVAFTSYEECYTGIGDNPSEAIADALEQAAQCGWDVDAIDNDGGSGELEEWENTHTPSASREFSIDVSNDISPTDYDPENGEFDEDKHNEELERRLEALESPYYFLSIRVKGPKQ